MVALAGPLAGGVEHVAADSLDELHLRVYESGEWWDVTISPLMVAGITEEQRAAALQSFASAIPNAVPGDDGGASAAFVLSGPRWANGSATWHYNPSGKPPELTGDSAALDRAAGAWKQLGGTSFAFVRGADTSAGTEACGSTRDGQNTVGWAPLPDATLAVTCSWNRSGNPRPEFVEFDMRIDPEWDWTTGDHPIMDLQSVTTHEFGHALGLSHTQETLCPGMVMCAVYDQGAVVRVPASDDISAMALLYRESTRGPYRVIVSGATRNK
ncbi:hypothetical protein AYO38_05750 [bacterium SCGC AG-212-C10]|nr:hypothetical protein AYO38_05750 [bacterium SCGC AG-212-C10]